MNSKTVRYRIERRCFYNRVTGEEQWVDDVIAGKRTRALARKELAEMRAYDKQSNYGSVYRIVRITTTKEVVR